MMGLFFVYIVKSSVCLALFYLFYKLLLSRETFHRFNRIALLSSILFPIIIPFIKVSTEKATIIQHSAFRLEQLLLSAERSPVHYNPSVLLQIVLLFYLIGVFFFIIQVLYSLWILLRMIHSGEKIKSASKYTLIITAQPVVPCSWMRYIFISRTDWEENRDEILTHEMAHIRYFHSWDIFIAGCCVIFHWFNPAAWLLRLELQNIHEYEADEKVLNQGIDAKKYQLLLIKKAVGSQRFTSMANSFNHSKIKKRITMMLKSKSNNWARLKYLFVLPLAASTIAAFAYPEISDELDRISSTKISELSFTKEVLPNKITGTTQVDTVVMLNIDKEINQEEIERIVNETVDIQKIQETVNAAIDAAKIQEKVEIALQDLQLQEKIEISLKDIEQIQTKIEVVLKDIQIGTIVEEALKNSKLEETIEKALEQQNNK
jgi:hypothetical protein